MGKNRDTYRANTDVIKRKGNTFNEAKSEYVSDCYKVWKSSYLNTNKSNVVTALNNKVSSYMENILNSYKNLVAFFEDYYNEIVDLEKALSEGSLSASKVLDVKIAISQLKAMAEGYDPDDIVINPKTGEFNEGRTKQVVAQSISALGVKDDFKVYVDASGKYREAGNMTSSEYTQYNNAVRTFGAQPDKINNFLGHETAVKLGGLNAASISKSPAAYAVMDASPFMLKSAGSTAFGGIYSDAEIATIEKAKASGAYQYTYMGVQTAIFFALGGTGAAEAAGSTILKSVGRTGSKKLFSDVVGDTIINAPLNVSDSLKQSQDVRGRINSDSFKVNLLSTIGGDVGLGGGMELGGKILKTLPLSSAISSPKSASGSTSGTVSINKPGTAGTNIPDINKPNENPGVQTTPETKKPASSNPAPKTNDSKPAETKTTPKTNDSKPAETKVEKQSENYSTITNQTNTTRTAPETSEPKIQTTTEKKTSTNDKEISKNEDLNKSKDKPETTSSKSTSESKIPSKNTDRMKDDSKNTNAGIGSKEVGKETMKRRVITRIVKNKDEVALKATGTDGKPVAMKNGNPQNGTIDYEMVNKNIDDSSNIIPLRDMSSTGSSGNGNVTPISSVNSKSVNENLNSQQQNLEMSGAYIYDQYRNANDSVVIEKGNPKSQKLEEVTPTTPSKGKKEVDEAIHEKQKEYLDKQIKDEPKSETKPSSDKSVRPEEKPAEVKEPAKKTEPKEKDTSSAKSNSDESHLAEKQQKFKESKEELKNKYNDYENANKKQQEALEKHGLDSEEYKIAKKEAEQRFEELNSATNNLKTKQQELRKLEESKSASTKKTSQKSQSTSNVDDIESRITELETSKKKVEDARKEVEIAEKKWKEAERKVYEAEIDVENIEKLSDKNKLPVEKASEKYNNTRDKVAEKEKALEDAYKNKDEKRKKFDEIDEGYNKKYEEYKLASDKEMEMLKKYGIDSEEYKLARTELKAKEKEFDQLAQDLDKSIEDLEQSNLEVDVANEELDKAKEEFDKVEEEFFNEEFDKVEEEIFNEEYEKLYQAQEQADKIENQAQQQLDEAKKKYEIAKNEYQNKQSRLTETINYEPKFEKIKEIKQSFENNYKMMREQAMEKLKKLYENLDEVRTAFGVNSKQYKKIKSTIAKKHEELKTIAERISKRREGVKKYFEDLKDNLSETIDMPNKRTVTGEPAPVGKSEPIDKVGTKTDEPAISKNKGEEEIKDTSSVKSNKDETSPTAEEQMPKETEKQTTTYKGDSSLKTAIDDLVEKGKNLQKKQDELDLIKESISNSKKEFNDVLENQGITYEKVSSGEIQLKEGSKTEKYYSEISKAEEDYQKYLSIVNKEKDQFMKNRKEMLELRDKLDEFKQNYDCDYYDVKHGNKQLPEEAKELFEEIKSREEKYKFDNDSNMKVKETKTKENEIDQEELGKAASSKEETLETTPKSTQSEEKVIEVDFKNKTKGASQPEEIKIDELNKHKTQTKETEFDDAEEISLSMIDSSKLTEVEGQIKTLEKKINDLEADVRLKEKADDFSKKELDKELDKIMKESKAKDKQIEKFEQETKLVKESYGDLEKRLRDSTPEDIDRQLEIQIKEKQKILDDIELERKAKGTSDYDFIYDPSPENVISNLETVKKNEFLELSRLIKEKNSIKNSKVLTSDQIKILETKYNNQIIKNHDRIKAIDTRIKELKRPNSKEFEDLLLSSRDKVDVSDLEKRMQDNIDMMFNKKVNTRKPFNAKELKQEIKSLEIQKKMLKNMEDAKKEIESYDKAIYVMKHNANSQTAKQVKKQMKEIDPVGINSYYRKNYPRIVKEIEESKKTLKELQEQREELLKIKKSSIESADLIEEITPEKVEELLGENHNQKDNIIELPTNNRKIEESSDDLKAANGEEIEGKKSVEDESEKTDNDKQKVKKVKKMAVKGAMLTGGIVGLTSLTKCDGNENTTGSEKSTIPEDDKSDSNKDIPEDDKSDSNKEKPDKTERNPESEKESSDKPEQNPESNKDIPEVDKSDSNKEKPDKTEQNSESEKESSDKPEQNPESNKDKPEDDKSDSNKENPDKTEQNPESEKESSDKPEQNPESNKDKPEDDKSDSNKENSDKTEQNPESEKESSDKPEQNPESEKESSDKPEQNPESEKDKPNTSKGYSSTSEKTSSNSANKNQVSDNSDSTSQRNTNSNSISDGFNENNNSTASSNNKRVDFNKFRVPAESNESEQSKKNDSEINSYDFENSTNSDFKEEVEDSNSFDDYFENEILSEDNNDENEEKQKESTISKGSSFIKENASSIGIGAAAAAGAGLGIVGLVKKSKEDKNKNDFEIEEYEEENDFSHNSDQESEKNNKKFHNPFTALRVKKEDDASFDD